MRDSLRRGRDELVVRVQSKLFLATKKESEYLINAVVSCLEESLLDNLDRDRYTIKLGSFGKFTVKHKPGTLRKIPFTGETKVTNDKRKIRFISLGKLRKCEPVIEETIT